MSDELLPCPFCGGKAEVVTGLIGGYNVACMRVDCDLSPITRGCATEAEAITAWNTRYVETCELIDFIGHELMDEPDIIELSCGHDVMVFDKGKYINYCPECGRKVEVS